MKQEKALALYLDANRNARKAMKLLIEWDESLTKKELAIKLQLMPHEINRLIFYYRLDYKKLGKQGRLSGGSTDVTEIRIQIVRELRNRCYTMESIAKILGVTKQYVDQLLEKNHRRRLDVELGEPCNQPKKS